MYCVVEFDGENANQTAVVRSEWLTPKKMEVFWPPFKLSSKFNKALSEGGIPNEETWTLYPVRRCLYFSDDILKTRQKEREAEKDSDLQTDADVGSQKKKRRKRPVIHTSSDKDIEEPTAKKKLKFSEDRSKRNFQYPSFSILSDGNIPLVGPQETILTPSPGSSPGSKNETPSIKDHRPPISTATLSVTPSSSVFSPTPTRKEIVSNSGFNVVADKLAKLELEIAYIKQYLEDFLPRLSKDTPPDNDVEQRDLLPPLPCNEKIDITNLEDWLMDLKNQDLLVKYFSRIGGRTAEYIVKKILERVFTKNLALQYNWTGKHQKFSLKGLRIVDIIFRVAQNNKPTAEVTECDVIQKIRSWFRFAKDRDGGREERRNKNL